MACEECPPEGAPGWMVTYGDLMTLLLCFFVLLFSFSSLDVIVMKSLKESYTGAHGLMKGHSAFEGLGVSHSPQKMSSKLFDMAMEKVRKAKSDKFPREQLVYLNAIEEEMEKAQGMVQVATVVDLNSIDNLEHFKVTVQQMIEDDSRYESDAEEVKQYIRDFMAKTIDELSQESQSERLELRLLTAPSIQAAAKKLNDVLQQRNYSDEPVEKVLKARGDQYMSNLGDSSRNRKMVGRNLPMAGNPGENELEEMSTGQRLKHLQRMDRVEGEGSRKRFDHPVPQKEFLDSDRVNVSGEVKDSLSDANRVILTALLLDAGELFFSKSARIRRDEFAELKLKQVVETLLAQQGQGYFQIECYTDDTPALENMDNRELTMQMAINLVSALQAIEPRLRPSNFAAVGWGDSRLAMEQKKKSLRPPNRIEIRLIKPRI